MQYVAVRETKEALSFHAETGEPLRRYKSIGSYPQNSWISLEKKPVSSMETGPWALA
jgi:hypothetical protein